VEAAPGGARKLGVPPVRIEVLYFDGCPHAPGAFELVQEAAELEGVEVEVERVLVESDEEARTQRFIGSPTIRVEGNDVELAVADRTEFAVACRVYDTPTGKRGLPAVDVVRAALGALR
jgi:hypothetical protein